MKYSRPGGISMVEKPPLHTYDISLEVEAHGGYGGLWRPFYLLEICMKNVNDVEKSHQFESHKSTV